MEELAKIEDIILDLAASAHRVKVMASDETKLRGIQSERLDAMRCCGLDLLTAVIKYLTLAFTFQARAIQ